MSMDPRDTLSTRTQAAFTYGKFGESTFRPGEGIVLVAWNSEEGRARLSRSRHAESFFHLAHFFQPQINPVYCGVASAVIVLNALRLPRDKAIPQTSLAIEVPGTGEKTVIPFSTFAQSTFLGERTEAIKRRAVVEFREQDGAGSYRPGLGLLELQSLLQAYDAKVEAKFGTELDEGSFRKRLRDALATPDQFMIVHFRSDRMGGIPRGHISPLGAYDEASDSVLVLDVAGHKGPWYWAPCTDLLQAMQVTYDTQPRGGGLLVVRD